MGGHRGIKEDSEDLRRRISLSSLSDLEESIMYQDGELRKRNTVPPSSWLGESRGNN